MTTLDKNMKLEAVLRQLQCEVHPPLSLLSSLDQIECHMCTLYLAQIAFGALQWGEEFQPTCHMCTCLAQMAFEVTWGAWGVCDIQLLSEPQNGHPAITARCSDHKWTLHKYSHLWNVKSWVGFTGQPHIFISLSWLGCTLYLHLICLPGVLLLALGTFLAQLPQCVVPQ